MFKEKKLPEFLSPFSAAYWKKAASELKNVRSLVICAILIAARVALKSLKIPVGDSLYIYIGFLVNAVSGAIGGPVLALLSGAICDILGCIFFPTGAFMPVFTLIEMFSSFCYGICLYSTEITVPKIALSKALVNVFANILFNSLALNALYGKGVLYYLLSRIVKNILMLPLEVMLLVLLFNALTPVLVRTKLVPAPQKGMEFKPWRFVAVFAVTLVVIVLTYFYYGELKDFFSTLLGL